MATNPLLKKMLDAGMQFTEISQKQAEKLVKEFVKVGQARRKDSDELVRQIVDRGRTLSEQVVATVQAEFAKQMGKFAGRLDDVEGRVEALAAKMTEAAKSATEKVSEAAKSATEKVTEKAEAKMAPAAPATQTHVADSSAAPTTSAKPTGGQATKVDSQSD